ncbi:hypothetical protein SB48_HM08orf04705 [Heyndrickxia coagulans]|uniref:Uncharacterized protein n=1 Tax=Heyndrickxia coagulans TaxID=1398 RepID=A0AAN0WD28_HEYCO|nr:hypothetical protein SB48_HM08orf04705 [Heyndrickxia coagulans]
MVARVLSFITSMKDIFMVSGMRFVLHQPGERHFHGLGLAFCPSFAV